MSDHTQPPQQDAGEVQRHEWSEYEMLPVSDGDYVFAKDYDQLKAECARLKADNQRLINRDTYREEMITELKSERASLRAALASQQDDAGRLADACTEFRDAILHGLDQFDNWQTNAVLNEFDAIIGNALPAPPAPKPNPEDDYEGYPLETVEEARRGLTFAEAMSDRGLISYAMERIRIAELRAAKAPPAPASEQDHSVDANKVVSSPSANAVDPGEGWRLLDNEKDETEYGDEVLAPDGRWFLVSLRNGYELVKGYTYRRRITAQAEQGGAV